MTCGCGGVYVQSEVEDWVVHAITAKLIEARMDQTQVRGWEESVTGVEDSRKASWPSQRPANATALVEDLTRISAGSVGVLWLCRRW